MKNCADQGEEGVVHRGHLKAKVDNTLRDLHNSLYPTKAELLYHTLKIIPSLKTS